ncbi:MAG: AMP-binding protein, partial [Pyrinomonadaceae bacterium]
MHDVNVLEDQPIAWTPTADVIERAQITRFMKQIGVSTWDELYEYSIANVERFTEEVLKFLDIKFDPPYEKLLDTSDGIEFPTWFRSSDTLEKSADPPVRMSAKHERETQPSSNSVSPENVSAEPSFAGGTGDADKSVRAPVRAPVGTPSAGLNITEMCLDRWQTDEMKDQPAVIWEGEEGGSTILSYAELKAGVDACVEKLVGLDLGQGDAVGMHLPMIPETVIALLAINRIGAIAVPVFSGYGIDAISSRMEAVGAKAIFTCDGFPRRGKAFDMMTVAARAVANVPSIESVILVERSSYVTPAANESKDHVEAREERRMQLKHYEYLRHDVFAGRRIAIWGVGMGEPASESSAAKTSAEDPLIILYTSGTTGKPKGIAHTHASFPIKAAQDMAFGTDVGKGTRISWYTDVGWMMGPWLIYGALINGATICIYDGAPDYPNPDRLWEFTANHKVEILGISPTLIRSLAAAERSADTPVRMDAAAAFTKGTTTERRGWYRHRLPHYDGTVTQF